MFGQPMPSIGAPTSLMAAATSARRRTASFASTADTWWPTEDATERGVRPAPADAREGGERLIFFALLACALMNGAAAWIATKADQVAHPVGVTRRVGDRNG